MKQRTLNNQDGIALGPILFIIAILAIIAAAIAAGSGEFTANTNTEQDKQNAQALINYVAQMKNGIDVVLSNGCSATQINFYTPDDANPANPNAPTDHSCDIYDPRGGGVTYHNFLALPIFDSTKTAIRAAQTGLSVAQFSQGYMFVLTGFGANPTLMFEIFALTQNMCTAINKIVNYNPPSFAPLTEYWWVSSQFTGTYVNNGTYDLGMSQTGQGCVYDGNPSYADYTYTGVLLAQ